MKLPTICFLACLLGIDGCSVPPRSGEPESPALGIEAAKPRANKARDNPREPAQGVPAGKRTAIGVSPAEDSHRASAPIHPEPDAVIKLESRAGKISPEMEKRLAIIINEAKTDERIMIRLESYASNEGSSALNLGLSEQTLQIVRGRLVDLGIAPRRIFLASFGDEHRTEGDRHRHWVEIYLIRPGH